MKAAELKQLSVDALKTKMNELEESLFNYRFQAEMGQLENRLVLRAVRRDIARVKTVLNAKCLVC